MTAGLAWRMSWPTCPSPCCSRSATDALAWAAHGSGNASNSVADSQSLDHRPALARCPTSRDEPADLLPAARRTKPAGPNALAYGEAVLAVLRAGGLPDRVAVFAFDTLSLWCSAFAYEISAIRTGEFDEKAIEARGREIGAYMAARPAQFPNLLGVGQLLSEATAEERFEFAMDVFLAGLTAAFEPRRRAADRPRRASEGDRSWPVDEPSPARPGVGRAVTARGGSDGDGECCRAAEVQAAVPHDVAVQ